MTTETNAPPTPRWKLSPADPLIGQCQSCGRKVSHEIACGMSVHVMCAPCMRAIAEELDRRDAKG